MRHIEDFGSPRGIPPIFSRGLGLGDGFLGLTYDHWWDLVTIGDGVSVLFDDVRGWIEEIQEVLYP